MRVKNYFLRMLLLVALIVPWVTQAQNTEVREYEYSYTTAPYSSISSTGTPWTAANRTDGHVDVQMPFGIFFGLNEVPAQSTLSVFADGHVAFNSLEGSVIAPLQYSSGYVTTMTSVYTRTTSSAVTVEWRKVVANGSSYSFQLWIYNNGDFEFRYGPMTYTSTNYVFVGFMSSGSDLFRCGSYEWDEIIRLNDAIYTRELSSNYPIFYDAATSTGAVYSFHQPDCVKPSELSASLNEDGNFELHWTSDATSFQVKYSTDPDFDPNSTEISPVVASSNTKVISTASLEPLTNYYFYVRTMCGSTPSGWTGPVSAKSPCGVLPLPYAENFENYTATSYNTAGGDIPECWDVIATGTMSKYAPHVSTSYAPNGKGFVMTSGGSDYGANNFVVLPELNADYANTQISFSAKVENASYGVLSLGYITDVVDASTFVEVAIVPATNSAFNYTYMLNSYSIPSNARLAFRWTHSSSYYCASIDDVVVENIPSCPTPVVPVATADGLISWASSFHATSYDLLYGLADFDPETEGTPVNNISGTTHQLTALESSTEYDVYLRAHCSATNEVTDWVGPVSFVTPCMPLSLPYSEDFESYTGTTYSSTGVMPNCWLTYQTNGTSYIPHITGSGSYWYPHSGSKVLTMTSGPSYGGDKYAILPEFEVALNALQIGFWYRFESAGSGTLTLGYLTSADPTSFVPLTNIPGTTSITYFEYALNDVPATATRIALKWSLSSSYFTVGIDDILVSALPTCIKPTIGDVTNISNSGATLNWTENSSATQWVVKYANHSFNPATDFVDSMIVNGTPSANLSYLNSGTTYYYAVRSLCSSEDISDWSNVNTFSTLFGLPFAEDFSNTTFPPIGWSRLSGMMSSPSTTSSGWSRYTTNQGLAAPHTKINLYSSSQRYYLVTPPIYINADQAQLSFDLALTKYNNTSAVNQSDQPDDRFIVLISTDNGDTWSEDNALAIWDNQGSSRVYDAISNTGETIVLPLNGHNGETIMVAFYGESITPNGDNDLHIDNIEIDRIYTCQKPNNLVSVNRTLTTAEVTWNETNDPLAGTWEVVCGPQGFDPSTTPAATVTTNSYTFTGLTPFTEYDFYVRAVCDASTNDVSGWSNAGHFSTNYCTPAPESTDNQGIVGVAFGSGTNIVNNTLSSGKFYNDFSSMVGDGEQGAALTVDITYATGYTYDTKIWVDWNDDLDFDDAGENVYSGESTNANPTTLTASFTIPLTATLGNHRMRIGGADSGPITPCYTGTYAALQDYTLNVTPAPTCFAPGNLTLISRTLTTAEVSWSDPNTNPAAWQIVYGVEGFDRDAASPINVTAATYTFTDLTEYTNYDFYVRAVCDASTNDVSNWSAAGHFNTNYCTPAPASTDGQGIVGVAFGSGTNIVNNTLSSGELYNDFSSMVGDGEQGTALTVDITYATGCTYDTKIWVDWNDDLDFDDEGENVYSGESTNANPTTLTASFPIPLTATLGNHRMRIGGADFGPITPCYTGTYAALQDYTLNVTPAPTCWVPDNLVAVSTVNSAELSWDENTPDAASRWQIVYGEPGFDYENAEPITTTNKPYTLTGLQHATNYEFHVRALCSETDMSKWSNAYIFSTACGVFEMDELPLVENFDSYAGTTSNGTNILPLCWSYNNVGTSSSYYGLPTIFKNGTTIYSNSGDNCLKFYSYYSGTTSSDEYAILPEMGFDVDIIDMVFYARMYNASYAADIIVGVMTGTDVSTFEPVETVSPASTSYEKMTVSFANYSGTGRNIAFKCAKPTSSYAGFYIDDVTVKVRENSRVLPNNSTNIELCEEYIIPTLDEDGTYAADLNVTHVIRPSEPGKVVHLSGTLNTEFGYDFLSVYEGVGTNGQLLYRGSGLDNIDVMTSSNDWVNNGAVTIVFTSDESNVISDLNGFKLLVNCECPMAPAEPVDYVDTVNGTYTWINGVTYTHNSTTPDAEDLIVSDEYTLVNQAGCDSLYTTLHLLIHPTYTLDSSADICERDVFEFYGQQIPAANGTFTVTLQSQYGADSTGVLTLHKMDAPTVNILYNGRNTLNIANYCDNASLTLNARSSVEGVTFEWEDMSAEAAHTVYPHDANTYSVFVTDTATHCTSLPATITVTTTPVAVLSISASDSVVCAGQPTTLTVSDANGLDLSYRWSNGATTQSITVNPTETTLYSVTATTNNASKCESTAQFTVNVNALPEVDITLSADEICLNDTLTLSATEKDGFNYLWTNANNATTASTEFVPAASGTFSLKVTDANGCQNEFTSAPVTVHPSYELNDELSACIGMIPYSWGNMQLVAEGNFDQTFTIAHGCDSIVHLNFIVKDTAVTNYYREYCKGAAFSFGEGQYAQDYTAEETGIISYVDITSGQCPARFNLNLTVNEHVSNTFDLTVCDSNRWNGELYTETGAYNQTLVNYKGCDSVVTMNLTVNKHSFGEHNEVACDSLVWNNETYYTVGDYAQTFAKADVNGCDSTETVHLTAVNHATYGVDDILWCDSKTYTWIDDVVYNMSETDGNISFTLPNTLNTQGCDTTAILNLVLNLPSDTLNWADVEACDEYLVDTVACNGDIAQMSIMNSGDYQFRTRNAATGKDVISRIHLTVNKSGYNTYPVTECVPYTWNLQVGTDATSGNPIYYEVGTYNPVGEDTVISFQIPEQYSNGCGDIAVLRLHPLRPTAETETAVVCQNQTYTTKNGSFVDASTLSAGVHNLHLVTTELDENGCPFDSTLVLTVNPVYSLEDTLTLCESEFTFNESLGQYVYTVVNPYNAEETVDIVFSDPLNETPLHDEIKAEWSTALGCDSTVNIRYTVNPTTYETVPVATCYKYTWDLNGETYYTMGNTLDTVVLAGANTYGCDRIAYLDLTLTDTIITNIDTFVCTEYVGMDGVTYRENMSFRKVVGIASTGCDSVVYYNYIVKQRQLNEQFVASSSPYTWANGMTYSDNVSDVFFNLTSEYGCDSTLMLTFTKLDTIVLCEGQLPYNTGYGFTIDENAVSGVYSNNDANGNDTIVAYVINRESHNTIPQTICERYNWHGTEYNLSGSYTYEYLNEFNCPSVDTLQLTILNNTDTAYYDTVCNIVFWNGTEYTESGDYIYNYTPANGCASVDTLHLVVNYNDTTVDTKMACVSYTWQDGIEYTESNNTAKVSLQTINGCDSIVLLDLTINQPTIGFDTLVEYSGSYRYNGVMYYAPTNSTFYDTLVNANANGCDSIHGFTLLIPQTTIYSDSVVACGTYTWEKNGHTYSWIPMSERLSHGMALYKDVTTNSYVMAQPMDTVFNNDRTIDHVTVLWLTLAEATYNTATIERFPLSQQTLTLGESTLNFSAQLNAKLDTTVVCTVSHGSTYYCDSIVTYTINLVYDFDTTYDTVCGNVATYPWNGVNYDLANEDASYSFTQILNEGTPQEQVSTKFVYRGIAITSDNIQTACDQYTWNDSVYKVSTEDTFTYTAANGCDSVVTLKLTVNYGTYNSDALSACGSFSWNDSVYAASGVYTHSYTNADNCPSVDTLHLTILPVFTNNVTDNVCYNGTYEWQGNTYANVTANVNDTLVYTAANGCDSILTLALSVNEILHSDSSAVACGSYTWQGNTYNVEDMAGYVPGTVFYDTILFTSNGCDSICTLALTLNAAKTGDTTVIACESYDWYGETYLVNGDYTHTLNSAANCDSVVTLHLTVNHGTTSADTITSCDTYTWLDANDDIIGTYTESGDYLHSYTNAIGCPSVDSLNLTINKNSGHSYSQDACTEYTWSVNGRTYTVSDTYIATYTDGNNCSSIDTLYLTIKSTSSYDSTLFVSEGSYRYKDSLLLVAPLSQTFLEYYTNAQGCDSILNVTINVGNFYYKVEDAIVCNQYTWRDGNTYAWISAEERAANGNALYKNVTTGEYVLYNPTFTVHQENDYDSIYMLSLNLTQSFYGTDVVNFPISLQKLHYGDSIFDFSSYNDNRTSGVETREVHFGSTFYCDSIIDVTITLVNNYDRVEDDDICVTQTSYTWRDHTIPTVVTNYDSIYTYEVRDTIGDSLQTRIEYLALTQHPFAYATERRTACDSYVWNNIEFTESTSNATFTFPGGSVYGCDSTVTLILTINHNTSAKFEDVACNEYFWTATGGLVEDTFTTSGTYFHEYLTAEGCPSVDTLVLTVNNSTHNVETVEACDEYTWNGTAYTESGTYTYAYTNEFGCSSVDTLFLTINKKTDSTINVTACDSYTWADNGETYTVSDTYFFNYDAANGCPSVNTLNLTINKNSGHAESFTACDAYSWNGQKYTATGDYFFQYTDSNNCASVDTLNLVVNYKTNNAETVAACQSYTWVNNGESFDYSASGVYTNDYVNEAGCASVDTLFLTIGTGTTYGIDRITNCGTFTWIVNGEEVDTYTESTETSTSFVNPATGCDSVVYLELTIKYAPASDTAAAICASELPYAWKGLSIEEAGEYNATFPMPNGCDSTVTLTLTVNDNSDKNFEDQICFGQDYDANGFKLEGAKLVPGLNTFSETRTNEAGCEYTATLKLTVGEIINNVDSVVACDSYEWNGTEYTVSGNYASAPYANEFGCTSIDNLVLTINNNAGHSDSQIACGSFTWESNDTEYTESGEYYFDYVDVNGCASVDTLVLTIATNTNTAYTETACNSYTWNGVEYTESGDYTFDYNSEKGCASTDTLHLTINFSSYNAESFTACDSYTWNNVEYTESGVYTFDYSAENGCASTDTLHLTINKSVNNNFSDESCGVYVWDGRAYDASGAYDFTYTAANGCDSVVTLNLTINDPITDNFSEEACGSFTWNGITYGQTGAYDQTFTAANGCDSIVTLNLTIKDPVRNSINEEACGTYVWNGIGFSTSGVYTQTFSAADGCDSIVTLTLTVKEPASFQFSDEACGSYTWNGETYNNSGIYSQTFEAANGCDSVVTLALNIHTSVSATLTEVACDSYTWNGVSYTASGAYADTAVTVNGCDSITTLLLTINNSTTSTETVEACDSYTWHGTTYTANNNTATYVTTNNAGCAHTTTLDLTINHGGSSTDVINACDSYTWRDGQTYTQSNNTSSVSLSTAHGCDSVIYLDLTINYGSHDTYTQVACNSYTWNGNNYAASGVYTYNYSNNAGCASVDTLHLTINNNTVGTETVTACDSYTWHGATYMASTNAPTYTVTNANGCDSVITLNLTINNSSAENLDVVACDTYTWTTGNGQTYTSSANGTFNTTNAQGCPHVVSLHLTINNSSSSTETITACDIYTWHGDSYSASTNVPTYTTQNAAGCDSVVTLNLTINHSVATVDEITNCDSYTWVNGIEYTESNYVDTYTYPTSEGCDSVVTLNLTINHSVESNLNVSVNSDELPYVFDGQSITSAGDYVFNYETVNGCDSIIYLHVDVITVGIDDNAEILSISVYPNPTRGMVTVSANDVQKVEVYDLNGRKVASFEGTNRFDLSNLAEGVYTLRITMPNGTAVRKVVKK